MSSRRTFSILFLLIFITGCTGKSSNRNLLTYDDLINGFKADGPVDESALTIPKNEASPQHIFEGRLELIGEADHGGMQVYKGADLEPEVIHLPEFNFEFVQQGSYLIILSNQGECGRSQATMAPRGPLFLSRLFGKDPTPS